MRAVLHDADGLVVNVIVLPDDPGDVELDYEPPDGLQLLEVDEDTCVSPGWVLTEGGSFDPPAYSSSVEPSPPSLEELQVQLEQIQAQIAQLLEQQNPEEEQPSA